LRKKYLLKIIWIIKIQWIELFGKITTTAKENGIKHFIVKKDMVENPEKTYKSGCNYLATL
jgi:hypothetical protein